MSYVVTCPGCGAQRRLEDAAAGTEVFCPTCGKTYRADPPSPAAAPVARRPKRAGGWLVLVVALVVLIGGGLAAYLWMNTGTPTEYDDPAGMFSARFPNPPTADAAGPAPKDGYTVRVARATAGDAEYSVAVIGPFAPTTVVGPRWRDRQLARFAGPVAASGEPVGDGPATVEGHAARQVATFRDGTVFVNRFATGERYVLRLGFTKPVPDKAHAAAAVRDAERFFDTVRVGPEFGPPLDKGPDPVPAEELLAAYQSDPAAADARFKDKYFDLKVKVGSVERSGDRVTAITLRAGKLVLRCSMAGAFPGPVQPGDGVTVTGKCEGLKRPQSGPAEVVVEGCVPLAGGESK
jgi:hypothetical protein